MARCAIPFVLQSPVTGSALVGDKFTFTKHVVGGTLGSGEAATIYTTETEATTTGSNVLTTDSKGSLTQGESSSPAWAPYWIAPGTYDILISGAGLKSVYIVRDLVSGEEESVGTSLLANLAVTGSKLGSGTVRQETGTTQSFLSWGRVSEAGAIEAGSGDFTVAKTGTGAYEVKWNSEKVSAAYSVVATAGTPASSGPPAGIASTFPTKKSVSINTYNLAGASTSIPFSFQVLAAS